MRSEGSVVRSARRCTFGARTNALIWIAGRQCRAFPADNTVIPVLSAFGLALTAKVASRGGCVTRRDRLAGSRNGGYTTDWRGRSGVTDQIKRGCVAGQIKHGCCCLIGRSWATRVGKVRIRCVITGYQCEAEDNVAQEAPPIFLLPRGARLSSDECAETNLLTVLAGQV